MEDPRPEPSEPSEAAEPKEAFPPKPRLTGRPKGHELPIPWVRLRSTASGHQLYKRMLGLKT